MVSGTIYERGGKICGDCDGQTLHVKGEVWTIEPDGCVSDGNGEYVGNYREDGTIVSVDGEVLYTTGTPFNDE